jgi:multicomponent Na+:H+ antiporter subunit F
MVDTFFVNITAVLIGLSAIMGIRLAIGRTVYDRVLVAGALGTNAIAIVACIGFIFARPEMFVDLAITYALLNFIGTVAISKYLEQQEQE